MVRNLYDILGVSRTAESAVIKAAYMALSKKYHPDVNQGNVEESKLKMQEINRAYSTLKKESSRRTYDATLNESTVNSMGHRSSNPNSESQGEHSSNTKPQPETQTNQRSSSNPKLEPKNNSRGKVFSIIIGSLVLLFLIYSAFQTNHATEPQLNTHYAELPNDISDLVPQVVEVFSLTCGHCLQMEKFIPEIEAGINQPVGKVHVTFNESAQAAAMFYYAAAMQFESGKPDEGMMTDLFNAYHANAELPAVERTQLLINAYQERGLISPYDLDEEQKQMLFEEVTKAVDISGKGMINSVPTFVVNGKYIVLTSAHNDLPSIINTINYLIEKG